MSEKLSESPNNASRPAKKSSEFGRILKQMSYNRLAIVGLIIFILEILLAAFAPLITRYDPNVMDIFAVSQSPSWKHIFGTDDLGRDIFSRILYGGRYSLSMGILSILLSSICGIFIGSIAGYFGGIVDNIIMRFLDIIQSLPGMLLTIVISATLGPGYLNTILALAVNGISGQARLLRAQMMQVRNSEYIEAARASNCSQVRIIISHLLPNSFSPLIVQASMGTALMITMASGLSFIGLGVQPPTPEWGSMLANSRLFIRDYPHMVIFPGLAIAITVLALNLLGDGLRDALDPKLKR